MHVSFGADETERVVYTYKDSIARIAFHYLKSWADAEDITQDVIIKWIQRKPVFQSSEHEKAWFIRVTINLCKDHLRSFWRKRTELSDSGVVSDSYLPPDTTLETVLSLPEKYRIVIYLHYYEGYSLRDIASILKKNPHTVQTWHERAKKALKQTIGEEQHELESI